MQTPEIDIQNGELYVKVNGHLILKISQVSDNECINLYIDGVINKLIPSDVADAEVIVDRT